MHPRHHSIPVHVLVRCSSIKALTWRHLILVPPALILSITTPHKQCMCCASVYPSCGACEYVVGSAYPHLHVQMFYKSARLEYHPLGVVGAIVPWNYPFHNVFNPLTAALYAGNALVIKVSHLLAASRI